MIWVVVSCLGLWLAQCGVTHALPSPGQTRYGNVRQYSRLSEESQRDPEPPSYRKYTNSAPATFSEDAFSRQSDGYSDYYGDDYSEHEYKAPEPPPLDMPSIYERTLRAWTERQLTARVPHDKLWRSDHSTRYLADLQAKEESHHEWRAYLWNLQLKRARERKAPPHEIDEIKHQIDAHVGPEAVAERRWDHLGEMQTLRSNAVKPFQEYRLFRHYETHYGNANLKGMAKHYFAYHPDKPIHLKDVTHPHLDPQYTASIHMSQPTPSPLRSKIHFPPSIPSTAHPNHVTFTFPPSLRFDWAKRCDQLLAKGKSPWVCRRHRQPR